MRQASTYLLQMCLEVLESKIHVLLNFLDDCKPSTEQQKHVLYDARLASAVDLEKDDDEEVSLFESISMSWWHWSSV